MLSGGEYQLDGAQRFLLDALNAQMQRLLRENNEELYERIERLENREHHEEERTGEVRSNLDLLSWPWCPCHHCLNLPHFPWTLGHIVATSGSNKLNTS